MKLMLFQLQLFACLIDKMKNEKCKDPPMLDVWMSSMSTVKLFSKMALYFITKLSGSRRGGLNISKQC